MILETKVNGRVRQSQNTKDLIFDIPTLIEVRSTVDLRGAGSVELTTQGVLQTISMGITLMVSQSHFMYSFQIAQRVACLVPSRETSLRQALQVSLLSSTTEHPLGMLRKELL
jgi:hypothetical protein